jgi:hypothetical protein
MDAPAPTNMFNFPAEYMSFNLERSSIVSVVVENDIYPGAFRIW